MKCISVTISLLEHIINPDAIDILLLLLEEKGSETFNSIIFEAAAKFIPIDHMQCAETFLVVHVELAFVVHPLDVR
jgi:hypothetical protein